MTTVRRPGDRYRVATNHVGQQVKLLRRRRKMSQGDLAKLLGLTFQQVQKYEQGTNRISSGALWFIAQVLDAPVEYFYQGLEGDKADPVPQLSATSLDFALVAQQLPPDIARPILKFMKEMAGLEIEEEATA